MNITNGVAGSCSARYTAVNSSFTWRCDNSTVNLCSTAVGRLLAYTGKERLSEKRDSRKEA